MRGRSPSSSHFPRWGGKELAKEFTTGQIWTLPDWPSLGTREGCPRIWAIHAWSEEGVFSRSHTILATLLGKEVDITSIPKRDWDQVPEMIQDHLRNHGLEDHFTIMELGTYVGLGTGSNRRKRERACRLSLALQLSHGWYDDGTLWDQRPLMREHRHHLLRSHLRHLELLLRSLSRQILSF